MLEFRWKLSSGSTSKAKAGNWEAVSPWLKVASGLNIASRISSYVNLAQGEKAVLWRIYASIFDISSRIVAQN